MSGPLSLPPAVGYLPVLHQMVDSGDLGKMHPRAPALYLAIKRFADYNSGAAEVSNKRLMALTCLSKPTFYLARQSLVQFGYISFDEQRHPPIYQVFEKVRYLNSERTEVGESRWRFVPSAMPAVLEALRGKPLTHEMQQAGLAIGGLQVAVMVQIGTQPSTTEPVDITTITLPGGQEN